MPLSLRITLSLSLFAVVQTIPLQLIPAAAQTIPISGFASDQPGDGDFACSKLNGLVRAQIANGQIASAEAAVNAALASASNPPQGLCAALALHHLAAIMLDSGRLVQAEIDAERALSEFEKLYPPNDLILLRPLHVLCAARLEQRKIGPARQAFTRIQAIPVARPQDRALVSAQAAALFAAEGKAQEAERAYLDTLDALKDAHSLNTANAAVILEDLGSLYTRHRRFDEARCQLDRAQAIFQAAKETVPLDMILLLNLQARLHSELAEWQPAEADLLEALSLARDQPQIEPVLLRSILATYAVILRHTHRGREAQRVETSAAALQAHPAAIVDVSEFLQASKSQKR